MTLSLLPNPSDPAAGFWLNLAGLVLPTLFAVGTLVYSVWRRKGRGKRLAYQVVSDVGLINQVKDLGEDIRVTLDGHIVNDARLKVVRLANVGDETITDASLHSRQPIRIEFTPPSVIRCAIHSTEPPDLIAQEHLKDFIRLGPSTECGDGARVHGFVELPDLVLNPKESINLKLLTRGLPDMRVVGHLVGGRISKFKAPSRRTRKRTIVLLVASGFLAAVALGSGLGFAATFVRGDCALDPGALNVTGSSAFSPTVQEQATSYQSSCPIARLSVSSSSSGDGLAKLERGTADIAMSEVTPADVGISAPHVVENRVAVLVFAVIVHRQVGVSSLSR